MIGLIIALAFKALGIFGGYGVQVISYILSTKSGLLSVCV